MFSRFSVPPTPEKEERVNPDIKRLNPAPSYERNRKVRERCGDKIFQIDDSIQEGKKKTLAWYVRWMPDRGVVWRG